MNNASQNNYMPCIISMKSHGHVRELTQYKEDKDLFIGPQEFVVGYSKAPEQPQSSARPICYSHSMTRTDLESATICIAA